MPRLGRFVRAVTEIRSAPGAAWVAVRVATTMLIVLLGLYAAGRLDLAVYANFGAFAAIYGGTARTTTRWRTQAVVGVILTAPVASGVLVGFSSHRSWLAVPIAAGWAALAAVLSDRGGWRPPGPMFPVFAFVTCAAIPMWMAESSA